VLIPPVVTPSREPTKTSTPTEVPPSLFPEPFLPPGLTQISAGNIAEIRQLFIIPIKEIYDLSFSPSGNKLATLSEPWDDRFNDYMEVWDLESGNRLLHLQELDSPGKLFFSQDENLLYLFFADKGIEAYDLTDGTLVRTIALEEDYLDFSPDGKTVAVGTYLGNVDTSIVRILDLTTEKELSNFYDPGIIMNLKFLPDGSMLSMGMQILNHYRISVWELPSQVLVIELMDYDSGLIFSPRGSLTATVKGGQVYIFSTDGMIWRASYGFVDPFTNPNPRDFSLNGDVLAIEDRYNIRFLVPDTGEELFNLPNECDVKFSPNGSTLVTWCYQGGLKIWGIMP
jgi:WD40 repeat protein